MNALALNRLAHGTEEQRETYQEIAKGWLHGIYKQIKNDQKEVDGDNIERLLSEYRRSLITNEDTHFIRKPKDIKAYKIAQSIIKYPNSENTRKALKFLCQQQDRNEAWPKSKGKWHGNMLNAVVQQLEKNTFKDAAILKDAFQEIVNDETQGFSITKPMEDKMVYFKIVYTYATEDARNELLENPEFKKQVEKLSEEKKEKLGYFFELIGEGEKDSIKQLNLQQQKSTKNQPLTDDDECEIEVEITQKSASNEETLTPYYTFDANGNSKKNNKNLLGEVSFKLQDSFLGLTCTKDRKAFALANNTRARKVRDENGNKIKDKSQRVKGEQVEQQRAAEKAAQEAVKRAGGDLKTISKKTMPFLKNTEFKFRINGEEVTLGEAVKKCLKSLRKKQQREQTLGILQGRIPEKSIMEQVGDMLHLNVKDGYFSGKELQSIREVISAQIIATQSFSEEFKNQTQTNDGNEKGRGVENQRTTEQNLVEQPANNILGEVQTILDGLPKEEQDKMAMLNVDGGNLLQEKQMLEQQIINPNEPTGDISPAATPADKNQTKLEEESVENIQQQSDTSDKSKQIDAAFPGFADGLSIQKQQQKAEAAEAQETSLGTGQMRDISFTGRSGGRRN